MLHLVIMVALTMTSHSKSSDKSRSNRRYCRIAPFIAQSDGLGQTPIAIQFQEP
jgi:hypothetical protein